MVSEYYIMGLNKFEHCNPAHRENFEYCCFKTNKVFCSSCWYRDSHPYRCQSTRCGHYEKLAHLVIDKTFEIKVMNYTAEMSSSQEKFENFYRRFFQLKEIITENIKQDLINKLPLFLWSMSIEMLSNTSNHTGAAIYEEGTCADMLKIIKRKSDRKAESLEEAINGFEKMNHLFNGFQSKT